MKEELGRVQFVPLTGIEGWAADEVHREQRRLPKPYRTPEAEHRDLSRLIARHAEPFDAIGVIYRSTVYVWFDESRAVQSLPAHGPGGREVPKTYPFGL